MACATFMQGHACRRGSHVWSPDPRGDGGLPGSLTRRGERGRHVDRQGARRYCAGEGMTQVARDAGLSRESLCKAFSGERSVGTVQDTQRSHVRQKRLHVAGKRDERGRIERKLGVGPPTSGARVAFPTPCSSPTVPDRIPKHRAPLRGSVQRALIHHAPLPRCPSRASRAPAQWIRSSSLHDG